MAELDSKTPLKPSVFDRLIGNVDGSVAGSGIAQNLTKLKEAVRRDLENLLNTRWRVTAWPPSLEELNNSLVNYGIPDFSGHNMGSASDREDFRALVENAIRNFEPRFTKVRVKLVRQRDFTDRTLRFEIEAELHAVPYPEPVLFESLLEPGDSNFKVNRNMQR